MVVHLSVTLSWRSLVDVISLDIKAGLCVPHFRFEAYLTTGAAVAGKVCANSFLRDNMTLCSAGCNVGASCPCMIMIGNERCSHFSCAAHLVRTRDPRCCYCCVLDLNVSYDDRLNDSEHIGKGMTVASGKTVGEVPVGESADADRHGANTAIRQGALSRLYCLSYSSICIALVVRWFSRCSLRGRLVRSPRQPCNVGGSLAHCRIRGKDVSIQHCSA